MTAKSAKAKGRALQYWVRDRLGGMFGLSCGQDDDCLIRSREMGQHGLDIILHGEAKTKIPYSIECKSGESFRLVESIKQARDNCKPGTDWLLVHKRKAFKNPIVLMDWSAFQRLLEVTNVGVVGAGELPVSRENED